MASYQYKYNFIPNEYSFGITLLQNHAQSKSFFHGIETNEQLGLESEKVKQELLEVEPDILEMNDDPVLDDPVLDEIPIKNEILDDNEIKKEDPLDDEEYYMNPGYLFGFKSLTFKTLVLLV